MATRFAPVLDLWTVANRQVNLVEIYRMAVVTSRLRGAAHKLLVVRALVLLVKAGGESKVGKLEMPGNIQQDIVWFDITFAI